MKSNSKYLCSTLGVTTIILSCAIIINHISLQKRLDEKRILIENLSNTTKELYQKDKVENSNKHNYLDSKTRLINLEGDTVKLGDIIKGKKLIFRYSVLDCNACVQKEFENIRDMKFDINIQKEKIVMIAYYQEIRDLIVTYKSLNLKVPIYILINNDLDLPIEKYNFPYYFIVGSNLHIYDVFIPNRDKKENTIQFLNSAIKFIK